MSHSLEDLVAALPSPKVVWVMVPAGDPTLQTVAQLAELLGEGDLVIDGGNSKFTNDQINADLLAQKGTGYLDCGVSGGVWGLDNGYGLMVGGDAATSSWPCRSSTRCGRRARARRASSTPARSAPDITPRWCTTASSTA